MVIEDGPPEPARRKGMLAVPRFEKPPGPYRPPARKSPWHEHFALLRRDENVGKWAIVSEQIKGGKKDTTRRILNDRRTIAEWLERNCPLEDWEYRIDTVPDTWCHRQLRIRFMGEMTFEQAAERLARRRARYEAQQRRAAENKAQRALDARNAALAEQERGRARARKEG